MVGEQQLPKLNTFISMLYCLSLHTLEMERGRSGNHQATDTGAHFFITVVSLLCYSVVYLLFCTIGDLWLFVSYHTTTYLRGCCSVFILVISVVVVAFLASSTILDLVESSQYTEKLRVVRLRAATDNIIIFTWGFTLWILISKLYPVTLSIQLHVFNFVKIILKHGVVTKKNLLSPLRSVTTLNPTYRLRWLLIEQLC